MTGEEIKRLLAMSAYEREFWNCGQLVAGMDEAGRGPLAGPVVAAAVIMPPDCLIEGVNDSKKLSEKKRRALYAQITEKAVSWAVGIVDKRVIDEVNILNAAKCAFVKAYRGLSVKPAHVFSDRIGGIDIDVEYDELVHGDALCYSIAAASIVAKETRDAIMRDYDEIYPQYGFAAHKGYGTKIHREAIQTYGPCDIHRRTFLKKIL